jgi:hypothetical protein
VLLSFTDSAHPVKAIDKENTERKQQLFHLLLHRRSSPPNFLSTWRNRCAIRGDSLKNGIKHQDFQAADAAPRWVSEHFACEGTWLIEL